MLLASIGFQLHLLAAGVALQTVLTYMYSYK